MLTTSDMELIAILIVISISLHAVWRDCVFLCTMLKNKIMGKGKKDENAGESKCCENWDGKNCCINDANDRDKYSGI